MTEIISSVINVFVIYAREDKEIKRRLLAHLNPLKAPYNLIIWHDDFIEPGQEWKSHIESKLEHTDLFLLLVSVDFMNSEFIHQVEFQFAVNRHKENKAVLIPLIINYCQWDIDIKLKEYDFNLNELQVLPDEAKPIDDWRTPEQAYNNIAAGIRKVLTSIKNQRETEIEEQQKRIAQENERKQFEEEQQKKADELLKQENIEKEKKRYFEEQTKLKKAEDEKQRLANEQQRLKHLEKQKKAEEDLKQKKAGEKKQALLQKQFELKQAEDNIRLKNDRKLTVREEIKETAKTAFPNDQNGITKVIVIRIVMYAIIFAFLFYLFFRLIPDLLKQ